MVLGDHLGLFGEQALSGQRNQGHHNRRHQEGQEDVAHSVDGLTLPPAGPEGRPDLRVYLVEAGDGVEPGEFRIVRGSGRHTLQERARHHFTHIFFTTAQPRGPLEGAWGEPPRNTISISGTPMAASTAAEKPPMNPTPFTLKTSIKVITSPMSRPNLTRDDADHGVLLVGVGRRALAQSAHEQKVSPTDHGAHEGRPR